MLYRLNIGRRPLPWRSLPLGCRCYDTDYWFSLAHTISQRLRTLKKIPPELVPLGMLSLRKLEV